MSNIFHQAHFFHSFRFIPMSVYYAHAISGNILATGDIKSK